MFDLTKPLTPNCGAPNSLREPSLIVIHGTASGTLEGSVAWLCDKRARASAHFVVGRDGAVEQLVPITRVAWHAGSSAWRGRTGVNSFSIGIELVCWGPLKLDADGSFRSVVGNKLVPEDEVMEATVPGIATRFWQTYTKAQVEAVDALCDSLFAALSSLSEIVGHSDVSPGRKHDPYPSFDKHMRDLQNKYTRLLPRVALP